MRDFGGKRGRTAHQLKAEALSSTLQPTILRVGRMQMHIWEINKWREWEEEKGMCVPSRQNCGASFQASLCIALTSMCESVCAKDAFCLLVKGRVST